MSGFRKDWSALIAGVLAVVIFELALILWTTHGQFTYTLDDPYIHLALAENLARFGHYGVNIQEYSSPSSSIVWPLLLAPFFAIGLGVYGPLLLNILFAVFTVLVLHQTIVRAAQSQGRPAESVSVVWALVILLAVNGFGVIFTGMEHSLHILVTVSIMHFVNRMLTAYAGAAAVRAHGHGDALLVLCVVLSPLIRFEGLAVSLFAAAMLIGLGKPRIAILSVALIALLLALYFGVMASLGLPWLPSSVLVKSAAAADVTAQSGVAGKLLGAASHAAGNIVANLRDAESMFLVVLAALILGRSVRAWRPGGPVQAFYVAGVLAVVGLHFAFGRFGWYGRYQSYVCAFAICAALHVFSDLLFRRDHAASSARQERQAIVGIFAALAVLLLSLRQSLVPVITTPIAAQNIYEQQRQMHEFVTGYWRGPVAVNDIGYVSFRNDEYVLDLWGLASEEARLLRQAGDPGLLRTLTSKHDIHLAMIYADVFEGVIPPDWRKVGELRLSTRAITPAGDRVAFFVFGLDRAGCLEAAGQIAAFSRTLARPSNLTVDAGACDPRQLADARP